MLQDLFLGLEGETQSSQADNTDLVEGSPQDTNIRYIAEPLYAIQNALSAAHKSTGDTKDLTEAMFRETATKMMSYDLTGHQPKSDLQ